MREEKRYLLDIAECIERIEEYTTAGKEVFANTRMIQDAVVRNFEIIRIILSLSSLRTEGWRNDVACIPQGSNPTIFNINKLMGLPRSTSLRKRYAHAMTGKKVGLG
jgi:hypothetical protein